MSFRLIVVVVSATFALGSTPGWAEQCPPGTFATGAHRGCTCPAGRIKSYSGIGNSFATCKTPVTCPTGGFDTASFHDCVCPRDGLKAYFDPGNISAVCLERTPAVCSLNGGPADGVDLALFNISFHHQEPCSIGHIVSFQQVKAAAAVLHHQWHDPAVLVIVLPATPKDKRSIHDGLIEPSQVLRDELKRLYSHDFSYHLVGEDLAHVDDTEHMAIIAGSRWRLTSTAGAETTYYADDVSCKSISHEKIEGPNFSSFKIEGSDLSMHLFAVQTACCKDCRGMPMKVRQVNHVLEVARGIVGDSEPPFILGDLNGFDVSDVAPPNGASVRWLTKGQVCGDGGESFRGEQKMHILHLASPSSHLLPVAYPRDPTTKTMPFRLQRICHDAPGVFFRVCGLEGRACCASRSTACDAGLVCSSGKCAQPCTRCHH